MQNYPKIAQKMVRELAEIASADPGRAIAFQGAPGANSHMAAGRYAPDMLPMPCFSFADAMEAVKEGSAALAIIPIENSQNGRVADIHFLLPESGLFIVDEFFLPIHHCLMAIGDATADRRFTEALSHPQALGQSRHFLRQKGIEPAAYTDTAGAAARVAELADPDVAAIAPRLAAELYGLTIIEDHVQDADHNMTRFVVLARDSVTPDAERGPVMTTLLFEVKNIPAALFMALGGFATNGVNLTKLESYIRGGSFAAAEFYVDIEGMPGQPPVDRALEVLGHHSKWVRVLGSYLQARNRE